MKIKQGSIVQIDGEGKTSLGFVITADCDIANDKYGKNIAYLRIVDAKTYVLLYWWPDTINRKLSALNKKMSEFGFSSIKIHDIAPNADVEELKRIAGRLFVASGKTINEVQCLHLLFAISRADDPMLGMCTFAAGKIVKSVEDADQKLITRMIKDSIENARSDYFFLGEMAGVDGIGWVVLLRELGVFDISYLDGVRDTTVRLRGQTKDSVRFLVSQSFANLYARIGLEQSLEREHEVAIELISESIAKGGVV